MATQKEPQDLVIVSKTNRMLDHPQSKEVAVSLESTKGLLPFSVSRITKRNTSFATGLIVIPDHLRSQLSSLHKNEEKIGVTTCQNTEEI